MLKLLMCAIIFVLGAGASWQVAAQTAGDSQAAASTQVQRDKVGQLEIDQKMVMWKKPKASDYVDAVQDQRVAEGDVLLVGKDGRVKVTYDSGCDVTYDEPGVYVIDPASCGVPAAWATSEVVLAGVGGAALGGYIIERRCDCDCPPVSR